MRYLEDAVHVDAPPEDVWDWLTGMADHYPDWHPDHESAEWISGEPNRVGSVMRAVERVGGSRENLRFELTRVDPPHRYEYRIKGAIGMLLPRGRFDAEPEENGGCTFRARIGYRFGPLTERVFHKRMTVLRDHQQEEGVNLKGLVEES